MSETTRYLVHQQKAAELKDEAVGLPPADVFDPVIEACKKDEDRTTLRENLSLSPPQRSEKFESFMKSVWQLRAIAEQHRRR